MHLLEVGQMSTSELKPLVAIVEDDDAIVRLLQTGLATVPCDVATFGTLGEFLQYMEQHPALPGCVIVDVYLPDGNGLDILEQRTAHKLPEFLPIIFMTGQGDIPMAVDSMTRGAWSFLPKPLDLALLRNMVAEACQWSVREEGLTRTRAQALQRWETLTEQEKTVARMMLASIPNKNIATRLDVSIRTVEARRHAIFEKLAVDGLCEFAQLATSLKIFPEGAES
jgi:two-component system response regulator DctR